MSSVDREETYYEDEEEEDEFNRSETLTERSESVDLDVDDKQLKFEQNHQNTKQTITTIKELVNE